MEEDDDQPDPIFALTQAAAGIAVRILDLSRANEIGPVKVLQHLLRALGLHRFAG